MCLANSVLNFACQIELKIMATLPISVLKSVCSIILKNKIPTHKEILLSHRSDVSLPYSNGFAKIDQMARNKSVQLSLFCQDNLTKNVC
jgi:hypothetical protein